jgi:hypothetical protein
MLAMRNKAGRAQMLTTKQMFTSGSYVRARANAPMQQQYASQHACKTMVLPLCLAIHTGRHSILLPEQHVLNCSATL